MEATLLLSPEQAAFLLNMGLVTLVTAGSVTVQDMTEEQFKASVEIQHKAMAQGDQQTITKDDTEAQKEFLKLVDPTTLPKA